MSWIIRRKEISPVFDASQLEHLTLLLKRFDDLGPGIKSLEIDFGENGLKGTILRDKNGKVVFHPSDRS